MNKRVLVVLALAASATRVEAQVPSTATPLAPVFSAGCAATPVLATLTLRYNQGDWAVFQRDGRALLDALRGGGSAVPPGGASTPLGAGCTAPASVPATVRSALDYTGHHVALVWIGADVLGKTQLMRAVVHWPEPAAYSADLPGVAGLTEVFVAASPSARAASLYTSTAEKDPFAEQLPAFVQALFGPLSATIAGIAGSVTGGVSSRSFQLPASPPQLAVTINGVVLPLARASIRLQMKAKDLVTAQEFTDAVGRLGTTLLFDGAGRSNPARAQVASLVNHLPLIAAANCAASGSTAPAPVACRNALDVLIKSAYDAAMTGSPSEADADAIKEVDHRFRALAVDALSASAELDMTFKNRPLTHVAFGAGSAVMAYARVNRVRTKLDDDSGSLVSDPLPRVMTMAFVNWSPGGYDDASPSVTRPERVRAFFGAALTPDFGVVGGVNVLLQRGIGIVGGVGVLFGKGAEADEVGKPPAASEDPFKLAVGRTVFLGISYNYK
jgi:hypothetical protein